MKKRVTLAVLVAVLLAAAPISAQSFSAQIQAFWNQLRTGGLTFTNISVSGGTITPTTPITVAGGGSGAGTFTAHGALVGEGTSAFAAVAGGTNCVLAWTASSSDPTCATLTSSYVNTSIATRTGAGTTVPFAQGGTQATAQAALIHANPANQTARSSSGAFVMMGLGAAAAPCTITPVASGRVVFILTGNIVNNTTATTVTVKMAEGTGTAPANNAAASGTVISAAIVTDGLTTALTVPFSLAASQTGLALGTAVWFDLQLQTSSTNTGQPTNIDCTAHEI